MPMSLRYLRPVPIEVDSSVSMGRSGLLSMAGVISQGFLRFAASFLIGHIAGVHDLGVVTAALATGSLLGLLWPTTTGAAASKFLARARGAGDPAQMNAVAAHFRRRAVTAAIAAALLAIPAWLLMHHGHLGDTVCVVAFTAGYSGYSFVRGILFGAGQMSRATWWDIASSAIGIVALVAVLLAGVHGPALVLPVTASYLVYTAASWPWTIRHAPRPEPKLRREMDQFVLAGITGTLSSAGFLQLAMIVAAATSTGKQAGEFAAALTTATPASMLAVAISLVLLPSLSHVVGSGDATRFNAMVDQATRGMIFIMVAAFGTLTLCARSVMTVLWGSNFAPNSLVFPLLSLALLFSTSSTACNNALQARSPRGIMLNSSFSLAGLVVGAVFWLVTVGRWGLPAVALGYLVGMAVANVLPVLAEWHSGHHPWRGLVSRTAFAIAGVTALMIVQHYADIPIAFDPLLGVGFLALWCALARHDLAQLLPARVTARRRNQQ